MGEVKVEARQSTLEDWQLEARKLELQGKQEQADAIRRTVLKQTLVPWPVFGENRVRELLLKVFREQAPGGKLRQQLYDYAACFDEPELANALATEARFDAAKHFQQQRAMLARKTYVPYFGIRYKDILRQCEQYGLEHRLPMNQTPLMAAAAAGNVPLVEALLARGADREAVDQYGGNSLHWALRVAFGDPQFARGPLAALYELLAPASIDVNTGERLVRIDRHLSEYFLFQTLWTLFKSRFTHRHRHPHAAFETKAILEAWQYLPANVVRPERNRRQHLSGVLARNEVERDYAYNRALFMRVAQGWYQFNPRLSVRRRQGNEETWIPVYAALNLPLINEFAVADEWDGVDGRTAEYLRLAGMPARTVAVTYERQHNKQQEAALARAEQQDNLNAMMEQLKQDQLARAQQPPKWGTPEAKRWELERVREAIEARNKR